ncbi:hypothetical protein [Cryobacterium sp. TMT2-15-1]|uniref:hypothetical protein n=1 Tax=Cryobacterium sp. TMT2-15-1 TaxID=1259246 RepID=UPI00141BC6F1|nr:hypothetical protein [Cryobacterium sp. TMT2-15-1]
MVELNNDGTPIIAPKSRRLRPSRNRDDNVSDQTEKVLGIEGTGDQIEFDEE